MRAFVGYADRAGLEARVPTCPDWTVLDLVAHQGMVHRWAAALLRGERPTDDEVAAYEASGRGSEHPLGWLADGAAELAEAISEAPDDLTALVFLNDAPPAPRVLGQAAVPRDHDARGRRAGRLARAGRRDPSEVWIDPELAGDGIDELLGGFLTRPRSRLRCDEDGAPRRTHRTTWRTGGRSAWARGRPSPPAYDGRRVAGRRRLGAHRRRRRALPAAVEPHGPAGGVAPADRGDLVLTVLTDESPSVAGSTLVGTRHVSKET